LRISEEVRRCVAIAVTRQRVSDLGRRLLPPGGGLWIAGNPGRRHAPRRRSSVRTRAGLNSRHDRRHAGQDRPAPRAPHRRVAWRDSDEAERALDQHPVNAEPDPYLKRVLALELVELDELQGIFHNKGVAESDPVSGALCVKIAERRATLLDLNPPQGHAVQTISQPAKNEKSTDAYKRAFARLAASWSADFVRRRQRHGRRHALSALMCRTSGSYFEFDRYRSDQAKERHRLRDGSLN